MTFSKTEKINKSIEQIIVMNGGSTLITIITNYFREH